MLAGDWDGIGGATIGVYRSPGIWELKNANATSVDDVGFGYGLAGDSPVVGDWDGSGTVTAGIVRAAGGSLVRQLRNSNSNGVNDVGFGYGLAGDTPLVWR